MMNRRDVLRGFGALPALSLVQPGPQKGYRDPKMGFLAFGPEAEQDRLDLAKTRISEYGKNYGFRTVPLAVAQLEKGNLDEFAGFFVYAAGVTGQNPTFLTDKAMRALNKRVQKGGAGVVAMHGAAGIAPSDGPVSRNQPRRTAWVKLLGGESIGAAGAQAGRVRMADRSVPGMKPLNPGFEIEERWLAFKNYDPEMHVVMVQETGQIEGALYDRPSYPLTWLRYHGKGRVFYTGLGYEMDGWNTDVLRRSVVGGALWVLRDTEADVSPNLMRVTPKAIQAEYPV